MTDEEVKRKAEIDRFFALTPSAEALSSREIEYRDTKPAKIIVQIALYEYFERMKRHKCDAWQLDLCSRLQTAAVNRDISAYRAIIHAEGQLGKTSIISQAFPAWLFGHDPLFRYALAMYNVSRSQMHSQVVIQMMQSHLHRDIFPNKEGWLHEDPFAAFGRHISKAGWMTEARKELNDGQLSFNPVGLRSGLTGSGFDWLSIDDPYKEAQEAFSELINLQMQNFYDYTVQSRTALHSCISGMFHRYAPEDFAGFLLDTGDFEYVRYASQCDGDYIHEATGQRFPDPLGRAPGEYISPERRPPKYYEKPRRNNRVWLSMFQGKPSSDEGDFFNVGRIQNLRTDDAAGRLRSCVAVCRAYDVASSEEHGAYSVGAKMGIQPDGKVTVFELWRDRVDTAKRLAMQKQLAVIDGTHVPVVIPIDPGAAGKDVVYHTEQNLHGYTVVGRPTSGSKEQRALNFSVAVNSGDVEFVEADWNKDARRELRDFPLSDYKDIVDAMSDGYNHLFETSRRGLVVKNYKPQRNLVPRDEFFARFPSADFKIPAKWSIYAGVKIAAEASRATSAVIVARASMNSNLPEDLFVLDEYKAYDANMYALFDWLKESIAALTQKRIENEVSIWLHSDSEQYYQTIASKLKKFRVAMFTDDELAGHNELNWYLLPTERSHPFSVMDYASHLYWLVDTTYLSTAVEGKPYSFYHSRHELATWGFDEKGSPTKVGDVLDCLRMVTHRFKTHAEQVTIAEEIEIKMKEYFPHEIIPGSFTPQLQQELEAAHFLTEIAIEEKHGEDVFDLQDEDDGYLAHVMS